MELISKLNYDTCKIIEHFKQFIFKIDFNCNFCVVIGNCKNVIFFDKHDIIFLENQNKAFIYIPVNFTKTYTNIGNNWVLEDKNIHALNRFPEFDKKWMNKYSYQKVIAKDIYLFKKIEKVEKINNLMTKKELIYNRNIKELCMKFLFDSNFKLKAGHVTNF